MNKAPTYLLRPLIDNNSMPSPTPAFECANHLLGRGEPTGGLWFVGLEDAGDGDLTQANVIEWIESCAKLGHPEYLPCNDDVDYSKTYGPPRFLDSELHEQNRKQAESLTNEFVAGLSAATTLENGLPAISGKSLPTWKAELQGLGPEF